MKTYAQVLETVERALIKGEYLFCIEFLLPLIEKYPLTSKEGVDLRTILITAFCGINRKEEAKKFCKELLKSYDNKTRENAKYLMEIIDSPEIKKPDNWNLKIEASSSLKKKFLNPIQYKKNSKKEGGFINIIDTPTGETKAFQKGFTVVIFLIFLLLIPLLSGCVKIENTLDLSEIESINNNFRIESKYVNKLAWQSKFEEKIEGIFPNAEIKMDGSSMFLENKNLNLENAKEILFKIQSAASELGGGATKLDINTSEKNFIFLKKYNYKIDLDLQSVLNLNDLELNFKIISPNQATFVRENNSHSEIEKNLIIWNLIPGQINSLEFSFWKLNRLFIGTIIILLLIILGYVLKYYRFKIGTELPQLPSN